MAYVDVEVKGVKFKIDENLKGNMDLLIKSVEHNWDATGIIDGREGTAKSTLGKMLCWYLSKGNFSVDNIVFNTEQFIEAVDKAKPKTALLFDEMVMAGLSSDALSGLQKTLIKKFTLIRKKQLFIIMIIPYFFQLQKYFAIGRTRFLIHNYSQDGISRGVFKFYNEDKKRSLYVRNYKFWYYPEDKASFNFYGGFQDYTGLFIDEEAYEKKKDEAISNINAEKPKLEPRKSQAKILMSLNWSNIFDSTSNEYKTITEYIRRLKDYYVKT